MTNPDGLVSDLDFSLSPNSLISGYCSNDDTISYEDELCSRFLR